MKTRPSPAEQERIRPRSERRQKLRQPLRFLEQRFAQILPSGIGDYDLPAAVPQLLRNIFKLLQTLAEREAQKHRVVSALPVMLQPLAERPPLLRTRRAFHLADDPQTLFKLDVRHLVIGVFRRLVNLDPLLPRRRIQPDSRIVLQIALVAEQRPLHVLKRNAALDQLAVTAHLRQINVRFPDNRPHDLRRRNRDFRNLRLAHLDFADRELAHLRTADGELAHLVFAHRNRLDVVHILRRLLRFACHRRNHSERRRSRNRRSGQCLRQSLHAASLQLVW